MLAFIALRFVRKEKVSSESLFDQRKRIARQQLEMTPLALSSVVVGTGTGTADDDYEEDEETGVCNSMVGLIGDTQDSLMNVDEYE